MPSLRVVGFAVVAFLISCIRMFVVGSTVMLFVLLFSYGSVVFVNVVKLLKVVFSDVVYIVCQYFCDFGCSFLCPLSLLHCCLVA